jgi:transposase
MYSLFVGIDVSKDSFSVCGIDGNENVVFSLVAAMDRSGFSECMKVISSHSVDLTHVVVAMESTGSYHMNLFSFLTSQEIRPIVVNPLLIKNFSKLSLRKTKTDKKDAHTIARFLFVQKDSPDQFSAHQHKDLKDIARERESILKLIGSTKNDIRRMLKSTFPELERICDVFGDVMLLFLREYPSARLIRDTDPGCIIQAFQHKDKRLRISKSKDEIIKAAQNSIASPHPAIERLLPGKIDTLLFLNDRLDEVTNMLVQWCESVMKDDLKILTSMSGINTKTATPFLAETGDYRNYKTYKNFIAFSGLDPSIHESGTFKGMSRLSKRGNRHLRRIIYLMTFCAIRIKGPLKTYFLKRRNEGLPFKKALFATAHKLIRTIFAMLTKRTHYVSGEMITG